MFSACYIRCLHIRRGKPLSVEIDNFQISLNAVFCSTKRDTFESLYIIVNNSAGKQTFYAKIKIHEP